MRSMKNAERWESEVERPWKPGVRGIESGVTLKTRSRRSRELGRSGEARNPEVGS